MKQPLEESAMIELTEQQQQELKNVKGSAIEVTNPQTKEEYVLIRKELFERIKGLIYDDGEWTAEEQLRLLAESGKRAGWDAPEMDAYDNYDENRKKLCP
jgi:hypothetical protein